MTVEAAKILNGGIGDFDAVVETVGAAGVASALLECHSTNPYHPMAALDAGARETFSPPRAV